MELDNNRDLDQIMENLGNISFQDKNVLITGGAGFLGSWICDVLVRQGANVICLDNLASGLESNVSHLFQSDRFRFLKHDITEPKDFDQKLDVVIHMASRASPFEFAHFPIEILKANTIGSMMSLEIAKKHDAVLLYASTSEIYGNSSIFPTPESYHGRVNPIGPRGCYDEAKRCGEAYVMAYMNQYGLDVRIARIFNTYGPRMRFDGIYGRAVPRFIDQALSHQIITIFGDGSQTRSFTYLTDQIEGLLRLANLEDGKGHVLNIGNDRETSIIDLAKIILKLTNSTSPLSFYPLPQDDPLRRKPDISKAKEILGWSPTISLEDGLLKTIEWMKRLRQSA